MQISMSDALDAMDVEVRQKIACLGPRICVDARGLLGGTRLEGEPSRNAEQCLEAEQLPKTMCSAPQPPAPFASRQQGSHAAMSTRPMRGIPPT